MQTTHTHTSRTKFILAVSTLVFLTGLAITISTSYPALAGRIVTDETVLQNQTGGIQNQQSQTPKIQLAILLDTSSSMDGLIDMTRNQLWQVVNEFSTAKQNGVTPVLEIALFEYGNDGLSRSNGYVRKLNSFTRELDRISEGLFSLTTNGGSEYCGTAIQTAVTSLQWSKSDRDIKSIFIAGNEPFTQGPIDYREAIALAGQHGISINTIHAGDHQAGINGSWQHGATLAGGDYTSIDANQQVVHVDAPQDESIAKLNEELNQTYIPYGEQGTEKVQRQNEQDSLSSKISSALLAVRAKAKSSSFYRNSSWDLVDALNDGEVSEEELEKFDDDTLPAPMQGLSTQEKLDYVAGKAEERKVIQQEIADLSRARQDYVAEVASEEPASAPTVSDALTSSVKKQAAEKQFNFEN